MKKYRTGGYGKSPIEIVEVLRETDKFVMTEGWRGEDRHAKRSSRTNYWDTWEEARAHLIKKRQATVESYSRTLAGAESAYLEALDLPEHEPTEENA